MNVIVKVDSLRGKVTMVGEVDVGTISSWTRLDEDPELDFEFELVA